MIHKIIPLEHDKLYQRLSSSRYLSCGQAGIREGVAIMLRSWIISLCVCAGLLSLSALAHATSTDDSNEFSIRYNLLQQMSITTSIPWTYLAAIDQYERSMTTMNKKDRPVRDGIIAIYYPEAQWTG